MYLCKNVPKPHIVANRLISQMQYFQQSDIDNCIRTLRMGGVILYPTDTVWGIGCDATNSEAVERVFRIKRRADSKALIMLVDSQDALYDAVDNVPEVALQLIEAAVAPMTIIYDRAAPCIAKNLQASDGSVAVRVTSDPFCRAICRKLHRPLVSTSANISGAPAAATFSEISQEILTEVDYAALYRREDNTRHQPSSIIKISDDATFKIIR